MPAKNPNNGAVSTQTTPTTSRFELPALNLKFGSLTDGTDIPPPLPSPKQEQPKPEPETSAKKEENVKQEEQRQLKRKKEANGATNGTTPSKPDIIMTTNLGVKRTAEEVPVSPAPSSRRSLRRLLSKTLLNHAYHEQGSTTGHGLSRPPSRSASILADEKKSKRGSGWFWRLRSHDHAHDNKTARSEEFKKPAGPPPPMIPEFSALETKIDTSLGDDLFKGIGRDS